MSKYENPSQPPLVGLLKHLRLYGDIGIMDAATHLSIEEQDVLRKACRAARRAQKTKDR